VPAGYEIPLVDSANLSTGGTATNVLRLLSPGIASLAVDIASEMSLRLCGVDFIVDGSIDDEASVPTIIEANGSPGLDGFARLGAAEAEHVERIYMEILEKLFPH
jgi:D-alanine-D-alanine ligase-like ATP-grasp enzyme